MYLWEQILCYLLLMREAIVWWKWSASTKSKHSIIQSYVLSSGGLWLTVTKENEKLLLFLIFRNAFQLIAHSVHIYDFIFFKCKLRYFRRSDSLMFPTFEATFVAPPNHQWIWSQFLPVPPPRHLSLSQNKSTVWVHTWIDRPVFFTLVDQTTQTEPSHRRIWLIACFGFFIYMATVLLWCANLISWQPYIELKKSLSSLSALHICAFARRHCYV